MIHFNHQKHNHLLSEPFELRLLLSLKNDRNILSYPLICHAFSVVLSQAEEH